MLDKFFWLVGAALTFWWLTGMVMSFFVPTMTQPGTPVFTRIIAALTAGIIMPWLFITMGSLPRAAILANSDDPEGYKQWSDAECQCDKCRAKRGEK